MIQKSQKNMVSLSEAAKLIGVTPGRLRQLIRDGQLEATKIEAPIGRVGYYYAISEKEIGRYLKVPRRTGPNEPGQRKPWGRPRIGDQVSGKKKRPPRNGNGQSS